MQSKQPRNSYIPTFIAKFPLGRTVGTPAAIETIEAAGQDPGFFLERHARGDWGDTPPEDKLLNDQDIAAGGRLLSSYRVLTGETIWVLTEADRSATTILLPSEY